MSAQPLVFRSFGRVAAGSRDSPFRAVAKPSTMWLSEGINVEPQAGEVTQLLQQATSGNKDAQDRLFQFVFPRLRRLAANKMRREKPGHTLNATALVAEALLRVANQRAFPAENSAQFFATFALTMRRVLVDHARRKKSERNGGGWERIPLEPSLSLPQKQAEILLAVHLCLEKLEQEYPRHAKVVELRFFGGMSNSEIAKLLGISLSTVEADWRFARAWLRLELEGADDGHSSRAEGTGAEAF
jgi:RNA polymerase sigma-70 factor, ECF subfamily